MSMHAETELMDILTRVGQRDETALKALYHMTSARLHALSMRVVGRTECAEDVLQESYLQIWRTAGDYCVSLSPPMAWLGLIVRSRSLDCLRRRKAQRAHLTDDLDSAMADTLTVDSPDPLQTALLTQQSLALYESLRKLEIRQREAVCLTYLHDHNSGELADRLGLPLGTAKTRVRRGLEKLRVCMAPSV